MRTLWRIIVGFFAIVGAVIFIGIIGTVAVFAVAQSHGARVADGTVITLDLTQALPDQPPASGVQRLLYPNRLTLIEALDTIERASNDTRITGLVARIGDSNMGLAEVQELREAIAGFRAKGKRAVAYSDTFGELGSGTHSYYLASAFNEIWLQPMGTLGLVGLRIEMPYLRGTLDMIGVTASVEHREEYKDAANMFTEKQMTDAEREELQALLDSINAQLVADIAKDRKIDPATLKELIDHAPLLTDEAMRAHLVDHVGDRTDAVTSFGAAPKLLSLDKYSDEVGEAHASGPTIALIYATGMLARGGGDGGNALTGGESGTDKLVHAFRMAQEDKNVRAILFRVDSPGGSATAAETIWAAVNRARAAGKPVIVSMGDVAGSGGYYIAAPADKIVAEPATLTGSIGVVAGKPVVSGLMQKLGAGSDALQTGANAGMFSLFRDFSPSEHERLTAVIDDIYSGFKHRVAQGRKLDDAAVEAAAKGRVWSGSDALKNKLVDTLGGFHTALDIAKQSAGIAATQDVSLKLYPPTKTGIEAIVTRFNGDSDNDVDTVLPLRWLAQARATMERAELALAPPGALTMQPIETR
ncbi:MAG TPA: signal peptide peptidase SppA [Stellaceae bacterium]|jgi:protease-4|nr:signal peptide peptidase SppA [Stellaceae bacterium]